MKVLELIKAIERHPDGEVTIRLTKPSMGPIAQAQVKDAFVGIDWEHGKVIIQPAIPLVPKSDNEQIFDWARDLIMWLATKPVKKESYEVRAARKIAAKMYPDFMKYQNIFHRESK